jgi:hypothetical protein
VIEIKLKRRHWYYDPDAPLGHPGGFGAVFAGESEDCEPVAVKQLSVRAEDAAHRECDIATELVGKEYRHVIPVYDDGLDAESGRYYVTMAKAECCLLDRLRDGALPETEAVEALSQVVRGLLEVPALVHRDLKPANVLGHEGVWKIADFGIAKFVEESTSLHTLKGCLTPEYAAPEQWRYERSTAATDVYALGCLAFHLLAGHPPFQGDDPRHSHLQEEPPRPAASPRLQQLVLLCLRKNPLARPALGAVQRQLEAIVAEPVRLASLSDAAASVAAKGAAREAELERARSLEEQRQELARDALAGLRLLVDQLFAAVGNAAPMARRSGAWQITLGDGAIRVTPVFPYLPPGRFAQWGKDVVCGALILVSQGPGGAPARSANLWYAQEHGLHGWWEYSYFQPGIREERKRYEHEPFGVIGDEGVRDADFAGSPVIHSVALAHPPLRADGEGASDFIARWGERLAQAAQNALRRPSRLPEA